MNNNAQPPAGDPQHLAPVPAPHVGPAGLPPAPPSESTDPGINVEFVLNVLRRWWLVATPVGLILAVAACGLVYMTFEPEYESRTLLRIESSRPYVAFRTKDDSKRFVENQVQLIRSPLLMGEVIADPDVAQLPELQIADPVKKLIEMVGVQQIGDSDLFQITVTGPDPQNAQVILQHVTEAYRNLRTGFDQERTAAVISALTDERNRYDDKVKQLQDEVRDLSRLSARARVQLPSGSGDTAEALPLPTTTFEHDITDLQSRMTTNEMEILYVEAQLTALRAEPEDAAPTVSEAEIARLINEHPEVQARESHRVILRSRLLSTQQNAGPQAQVNIQQLQRQIASIESELSDLRESLRPQFEEYLLSQRTIERDNGREALESRLLQLQSARQFLFERYEMQLDSVRQHSDTDVDLQFAQHELRRAEQLVDLIADRVLQLQTERYAPERVAELQDASLPSSPVELMPMKMMGAAGFLSFFVPFGLAFLWEVRVKRVRDVEQLQKQPRLTVVGEIASLPARRSSPWRRNGAPRDGQELWLFEESVDSLRTSLVLSEQLRGAKVLAVTSAASQEGKTSVAAQLAVSIARSTGEMTLLVDGDMRSPDLHNVFDVQLEPGLAKVLDHKATFQESLVEWSETLHLLPAGRLHCSPHRLLLAGALKELLDEAQQHYRYVVFDTPPVLSASESLVLGKAADATLICAMRDVSRLAQVREVYDRLQSANARPFGVVLNGVPVRRYAYRYGKYGYARS